MILPTPNDFYRKQDYIKSLSWMETATGVEADHEENERDVFLRNWKEVAHNRNRWK